MQFIKKTSSSRNIINLIFKITLGLFLAIGLVLLLNKIDFPVPNKEIEKTIPNENFKIVK
jgi:capsular polysaccharide biosynthesis protein|tara:strand:+ start:38 stop:217 length:180 start_codon:yes stop_codon:yes gene_type:complete